MPGLIRALDDGDEDVRGYAAQALGRLGTAAREAVRALETLGDDPNPAVARAAQEALERMSAH